MYSYEINQSDTWIFYEKCGHSLGNNLYDIKAERVYGDQRLYKVISYDILDLLQVILPATGPRPLPSKTPNNLDLQAAISP